jgi:hypothetical protein
MEPEGSLPYSQTPVAFPHPEPIALSLFSCLRRTKWSVSVRCPVKRFYLQGAGTPLVSCPRPLIQHNCSYPPYLEAVPPPTTWGRVILWLQRPGFHKMPRGTIRTVHTTYAAALKTTTHPKTRCRKPYAAKQHLMLLMMAVCTRNMSS